MASGRNVAPVIIKRKKIVVEGGHHGGAWKVAYADFVTAMMAFFMLMWLLNATTEKQRKGIADYFSPVAPISRMSSGSDDMFMGESAFAADVLPRMGTGATSLDDTSSDASGAGVDPTAEDAEQDAAFKEVQDILLGLRGESMVDDKWLRHMTSRDTDEGLVLEFYDVPGVPLFGEDGTPASVMHDVAELVLKTSEQLNNDIAIEVHLAAVPVVQKRDLPRDISSDRALQIAQLLQDYGLDADRVRRIAAYGDSEPVTRNLMAVRNNRIEVIYLKY
jgi:chemotaxis protein MotB